MRLSPPIMNDDVKNKKTNKFGFETISIIGEKFI